MKEESGQKVTSFPFFASFVRKREDIKCSLSPALIPELFPLPLSCVCYCDVTFLSLSLFPNGLLRPTGG